MFALNDASQPVPTSLASTRIGITTLFVVHVKNQEDCSLICANFFDSEFSNMLLDLTEQLLRCTEEVFSDMDESSTPLNELFLDGYGLYLDIRRLVVRLPSIT